MPERLYSENELTAFKDWIAEKEIKAIVFDLDDTLTPMHKHFGEWMQSYFDFCVACRPDLKKEEIAASAKQINDDICRRLGVAPSHWKSTVDQLSDLYEAPVFSRGLYILEQIYRTSGPLFEGVRETLTMCKAAGLKLGVVTHAGREWTDVKLDKNDIRKFFDVVKVIDPEEIPFKGPEHWKEAFDELGVDPSEAVGVGDNLIGDVMALDSLGTKVVVWMPGPWVICNEGNLPDGVLQIKEFKELISTLCSS